MASGAKRSPVPSDEPKERLSEPEAAERLSEPGAASPSEGSESPAWLQYVLCTSAEAHRDMKNKASHSSDEPKHSLAAIKIEEFYGGSSVTVYAYRTWKKRVLATAMLYKLTDAELALMIYLQVKGLSKTMLDILEAEDLNARTA
jgi:hypothetical protein